MAKRVHFTPLLIAVILLLIMATYLLMPDKTSKQGHHRNPSPVTLYTVSPQPLDITIEALGTAMANESVTITAQTSDVVEHIYFNDGEKVKAGQLLVALNNREEQARKKELDVNLHEAQRQLTRISDLARGNVASAQLLDEQEAKVKALKAQLDVANAQLANLEVRAPFSGELGLRQVSLGALVKPGDTITTLDDIHQVKVDFSIAEIHMSTVRAGLHINTTSVAYPNKIFKGIVSTVDTRIDPITRAIKVRAIIDNPRSLLRPGMLLTIQIQKQEKQALMIPESSLIPIQDKQFVYVVDKKNIAHKVEVQIGYRRPGWVQIVKGLQSGQQVVSEGSLRLDDGARVTRVKEPGSPL